MSAASSRRRSFCCSLSRNATEWERLRPRVYLSIAKDTVAPPLPPPSPPGGRVVWIFINFQLGVLNWHQSFGSWSLIKMRTTPLGLPALPAFTSLAFRVQTLLTFSSRDQFEGYPRESAQATKQIALFFRLRCAFQPASWKCGRGTTDHETLTSVTKKEGTSRECKHCSDWNPVNNKKWTSH